MFIVESDILDNKFYIDPAEDVFAIIHSTKIPANPFNEFESKDRAFVFIKDFIYYGEMKLEQKYQYNSYLFKVIKIKWYHKLLRFIW